MGSRARRLLAPGLTAVGVIAATCFVAVVNPNGGGPYPQCPSQALLGIDCPGCGGLRATHALAHGDLLGAADHNLLYMLLLPIALVAFAVWVVRAWRGSTAPMVSPRVRSVVLTASIAVVLAFTVARNAVPYLGSGIG